MFTTLARLLMVDGTGRHVAVDCQLLARHPVQRKSRADLGHAGGSLGDHHEIHDQQHAEHHEAKENTSAHDEIGKTLDHFTGGIGPGVPLSDDQLGR